jgi:regulator of RNase E activity RraB
MIFEKDIPVGEKYPVWNFFYFKDENNCRDAADELSEIGFEINTIEKKDDGNKSNWLLICSVTQPLDNEHIQRLSEFMDTLAKKYNGEYDGFEIEIN